MMHVSTPRNGAPRQPDSSLLHVPSVQPTHAPPRSRRRRKRSTTPAIPTLSPFLLVLVLASFLPSASAVFVNFKDCLTRLYLADGKSTPYLRFVPEYVWADFSPDYRLNITVYGNVSGQTVPGPYPPLDDVNWKDPNKTFGKFVDLNENHKHWTTLFWSNKVLSYSAYTAPSARFCESLVNTSCPVAPAFSANASQFWTLPAISVSHDFSSSYGFTTWASTLRIVSGNDAATPLGCISASITPDLGTQPRA